MIRNLKMFGLALVASLALGAVMASASSAAPALFTAEVGATETAKVMGGQTKENGDSFTVAGNKLTCQTATVEGEAVTAGPSSTNVKLTPEYKNCHTVVLGITLPATVTVNGCSYTFNATKETTDTTGNATPFSADLTIDCPVKPIEIHIYASKAKHEADEPLCTFDVGAQGPINNHIQLTNDAVNHDVIAHITELPVTLTNTKPSATCGTEEHPTSIYRGEDTLTAETEGGTKVNSSVS